VEAAGAAGATDAVSSPNGGPAVARHEVGPEPAIELTTLPDGIRVITEQMPAATSVAVGVYAGIGSRDEPAELAGASHFLEHLLFKGTEERTAKSIAVEIDAVGGEMNAFTTREYTAYYCRLPANRLRFGLDLLADVLARPAFRPSEVDAERDVILDELMAAEDTPDDVLHMRLMESLFPAHALGRETLGSEETIESLTRDQIAAFHAEHSGGRNLGVAAAGDLVHDEVVDRVVAGLPTGSPAVRAARHAPSARPEPLVIVHRPVEQAHVAFGWLGLDHADPDRYALSVANQILGGGISSRLFQAIREERGLAYTVYSSTSAYADAGVVTIYAGTAPKHLDEVVGLMDDILDELLAGGITEEEHRVALGYLEGSMLLGLEDSGSRMGRLGGSLTTRGYVTPVAEYVDRIRAVTRDEVAAVLDRVFRGPRTVAAVGPFAEDEPAVKAAVDRRR
jgi:predicted Zn-dependent peptidase